MKKHTLILGLIVLMLPVVAQNNAAWLRYPSISPDGSEIVFSYKGDLYKVTSTGGTATPLTIHGAHDFMPIWSPDGKQIAFASDRFGNFDVYIMPASGGTAKRLTYHSANDYPWDFTPDGQSVVYSSGRNDINTSVRFPNSSLWGKLYSAPTQGGRNILISSAGFQNAHFNNEGDQIIFQDRKGYEDEWRKHHTSSVTRDIWIYNMNNETYTKVSDFEGEDREPVFAPDNSSFYYLSEKNGDQNIFKRTLSDNPIENQLTQFEHHPVRHLSVANNNTLCFTWNGDIYTLKEGSEPVKVMVTTPFDFTGNEEEIVSVSSGASEMALSPNGKEVAFVFRGEVFVTSVEGKTTKRITNSPVQERMLSWDPDGRTIYYSKEQGESWDIYKASIERSEEPYFFASTLITEEPVIATDKEEFQPVVSPDGKEIAYLEDRNTVKIFNLESKTSRTVVPPGQNFSYRDGDQDFIWSLDSKWLVARSSMGFYGSSYLVAFDAQNPGEGTKLTNSGFSDGRPLWAMDGKAMLWVNDKDGKRPLAYQGSREVDIYAMFFDKEAYDRFKLSKEEFDLLKEQEKNEKDEDEDNEKNSDKKKSKREKKDDEKKPDTLDWNPTFDHVEDWRVKLTPGSVNLASYNISPKGDMLYFMARFEKGYDIWKLDTRTRELKSLAKLGSRGGRMEMSKDGKNLFVLSGGRIQKIDTKSGKVKPVSINAEIVVDAAAEREYIFHHAWKQVKRKFYDPNLHGIDWEMYRESYARFLPHINNNYDFRELLSELLGELNGSHTGGRYYHRPENGDATASLGLFYDEKAGGNGLKITEVIKGGPLDKADSKIKPGNVIEKIDGETINDQIDWNKLLNRKADNNVLLSVLDPAKGERWDKIVKPISIRAENGLLYKRWVETMRKITEELSDGRIGYVHVQGMNDHSFRTVYDEVQGKNADKEALIVDTRFNGGGWLHEDLSNFLDGKPYATFRPYGFKTKGGEPLDKWSKPSAVLMSEGNYSDAHLFPYAYRAKGIGKLIGMPVPGTGTAVWWESQIDPTIIFGIPMIAVCGIKEDRPLENLQLEPDVKVENPFEAVLNGKDLQLKKAVEELLKEI
ncbi:MAG: S41 family peptidase [Bacteroidales bacterium]|nr:S41 family peptidase [Bacteroidales bacterium]MDY0347228.1 S41 family peptidase [Tenuifilaceae bacterium]